jgi:hypothetical protein
LCCRCPLSNHKVLYVHTYCVDNCLVHVADPVGYGISRQAKMVPKAYPTEFKLIGVVTKCDGKYRRGFDRTAEARDATKSDSDSDSDEELLFRG